MWESQIVQQIGVVHAGIQTSQYRVTTSNSKYFAFSAFLAVYVFDQKTYETISVIAISNHAIDTLALCNLNPNMIAISYTNKVIRIISVPENTPIYEFLVDSQLISLSWCYRKNLLIGFTKDAEFYYTVDCDGEYKVDKHTIKHNKISIISCFDVPGSNIIFLGGNSDGIVTMFDYTSNKFSHYTDMKDPVASIDFDLNGEGIAVVTWKNGKWAVFDCSKELKLICINERNPHLLGCSCFLDNPPGHFLTGDYGNGILRLWTTANSRYIQQFNVYSQGVVELSKIGEENVFIAFTDGLVGVFSIKLKKFLFKTNAAHRNTVFSLDFSPTNPDHLISIGAEGGVVTWDVYTLKIIDRAYTTRHLGVIHSMALTSGGGFVIVGYASGAIGIFSNMSMQLVYLEKICDDKITHLKVSKNDPNIILIGSSGGVIWLFNINTREKLVEHHGDFSYRGCAFFDAIKDRYIVGCSNGYLYVYQDSELLHSIYIGEIFVYDISVSPHNENDIAVSTEGGTSYYVELDFEDKHISHPIFSHNGPGRPIAFHPVIKNVVASSGYDGVVALYDTDNHKSIASFVAHPTICYGLAFSSKNPYLLVTSGCDTAIKTWTIDRFFVDVQIKKILSQKRFYLRPLLGCSDLIKLALRISRSKSQLTFGVDEILHINDIVRVTERHVKQLTSSIIDENSRLKHVIKSRERLIQAAEKELQLGNIKKYCEYMFAAGERAKAVAAAPAVSVSFWMTMLKASAQATEKMDEYVVFSLACNDNTSAIDMLIKDGKTEIAFSAACAYENDCYNPNIIDVKGRKTEAGKQISFDPLFDSNERLFEYSIASKRAKHDLLNGNVYLAAADFLSVGDTESATALLFNCGELVTAFYVNHILGNVSQKIIDNFVMFCINRSVIDQPLSMFSNDISRYVLSTLTFGNNDSRNEFYKRFGLPTIEETKDLPNASNIPERVGRLIYVGDLEVAVRVSLEFFREELIRDDFDWCICKQLSVQLEITPIKTLPEIVQIELIAVILIIASYEALWKGFRSIFLRMRAIVIALVSECEALSWAVPCTKKLKGLENLFGDEPNITIVTACYKNFNTLPLGQKFGDNLLYGPLVRLDDLKTNFNFREMLQWNSITKLSPLGNSSRYILF